MPWHRWSVFSFLSQGSSRFLAGPFHRPARSLVPLCSIYFSCSPVSFVIQIYSNVCRMATGLNGRRAGRRWMKGSIFAHDVAVKGIEKMAALVPKAPKVGILRVIFQGHFV